MSLWEHQKRAVDELLPAAVAQGFRRICMVSPAGSGKSTIIAELCKRAASKGNSVTVTAHRRRLIRQLAERLKSWKIRYTIEMADLPDEEWAVKDDGAQVVVGSRDTMLANLSKYRTMRTKIWIPDEAHCLTGRGYRELGEAIDPEYVIGPTATPCQADGTGFPKSLFDHLTVVTTIQDLIRDGLLVSVDAYCPVGAGKRRAEGLKPGVFGDPVKQWILHAHDLRTITFCRTLAECRAVQRMFAAEMIPCEHVDADSADEVRDGAIQRVIDGETKVLVCTPGLMGVGVDIPSIECVQTLVKNISPIPFWQSIGRGQRISPGKKRAVLLDHSAAVYEHGMPNISPEWKLGTDDSVQYRQIRRMQDERNMRPVICPGCGYYFTGDRCPHCDTCVEQKRTRATKTDRTGLHQVHDVEPMDRFQVEWAKLLYSGAAKGHKMVVAVARFKKKFGKWPSELEVKPLPSWSDKNRLVAEVFPQFVRT